MAAASSTYLLSWCPAADADRHLPRRRSGCGTDVWRLSEEVRAGTLSAEQFTRSESATSAAGGTATQWASPPRWRWLPRQSARSSLASLAHLRLTVACWRYAHGTGRLVVEMVAADRRPSTFLMSSLLANAIVTMAAVGGSTNAVVHLLAIAGRLGIDLTIDDFDRIGSHVPLLVDPQPAGRF